MKNSKLTRSALSLILSLLVVFSLFTVGVFAEEGDTVTVETGEVSDLVDGAVGEVLGATEAVTEAATETKTETEAVTEAHDHNHGAGFDTYDLVSIIILAVLAIVGLIYCLKNREKTAKFLRGLKSEFKKISWSSWKDVRKNTFVVLVVVIALALVVAGLDALFHLAIGYLIA